MLPSFFIAACHVHEEPAPELRRRHKLVPGDVRVRLESMVRVLSAGLGFEEPLWPTRSSLELAIVEYVGWFNKDRLHSALDDIPPSEFETLSVDGAFHLYIS